MLRLLPSRMIGLALVLAFASSGWAASEPARKQTRKTTSRSARKPAEAAPQAGALPFVPPLLTRLSPHVSARIDSKGLVVQGDEDAPKLEIGGRVHLDASAGTLRPRAAGPALSDHTELRRAWLEPTLTLPNGIVANLQYDFSQTKQPVNNALVAYRALEPLLFTVGNFKEPFSFEQLMSNNNTLFVERSLLDTFAPARDFGASVGMHGDRWTAVAAVFGGNINTDLARNGVAGTVRLTYAPILTDHELLHVGIAGSYRALDANGTPLSFSATPEDDLAATALVDTGVLRNATDVGRLGLEALYQYKSARVQAEYAVTSVGGQGTTPTRTFQAGYVQAAYVLNASGPAYQLVPPHGSEYAVLGGVKVPDSLRVSNGGPGVFELGARLSAITLEDGPVRGGAEVDATLGLNWYPDHNIRLMADYVHAHGSPAAAGLLPVDQADDDLFIGRLQFSW